MTLSTVLAALHFLGLGLAFLGSGSRINAFDKVAQGDRGQLKTVFAADNIWGASAILLLATGLVRAFSSYEKGSAFYLNNTAFYVKLGLFLLVFALEILPMLTLIKWRIAEAKGSIVPTELLVKKSRKMRRISIVQMFLLIALVLTALTMARGLWMLH
jgi:putative membrane protein